jgi:hypothetical protein
MNDDVYLVLAQYALDHRLIADVATHERHPVIEACPNETRCRHPVADQADEFGSCFVQP